MKPHDTLYKRLWVLLCEPSFILSRIMTFNRLILIYYMKTILIIIMAKIVILLNYQYTFKNIYISNVCWYRANIYM